MSYFIYAKKGNNKIKYLYAGIYFGYDESKKKIFKTKRELGKLPIKKIYASLPAGYKVFSDDVKRPRKRNPTDTASRNLTTNRKILKAIENFEKFTGHKAEFVDKKDLPKFDVAFKIGTCDGIMYTTVRDGRTEKYVHRFKGRARPILVSNFDGSFITLIGGSYKFTDRGIEDT